MDGAGDLIHVLAAAALGAHGGPFDAAHGQIKFGGNPQHRGALQRLLLSVAAGGGFSLALACDFRIMAKSAMLKQGYTSNGLTLDGGGTHTLPRLVGLSKALEIISFDEPMNSEKALALNLVNDVVDDDDVMNAAENMLQKISGVSPVSFGYTKQLLYQSFQTSFESQLESERRALSACAAGNDGKEGINAFLEKRKPEFNW